MNYLHQSLAFNNPYGDWLVGFYGISTFVGYYRQIHFYANSQSYFKQRSLAWVNCLIQKHFYFKQFNLFKQF